jgi:hypothetical protein
MEINDSTIPYLSIADELKQNINNDKNTYPLYHDPAFNIKIANKQEFNEIYSKNKLSLHQVSKLDDQLKRTSFTLNSQQLFVRNFLSLNTPYNNLLLYHGLGTGKTCTSITVAFEKIKYMIQTNNNKKIFVVASPNVQNNFKKELYHEDKLQNINGEWTLSTCIGNDLLKIINVTNENLEKKILLSRIKQFINERFEFIGYTKFSNIINDSIEENTIDTLFEYNLVIIDEVHNIRVSDDKNNKRIAKSLEQLVKLTDNMQLLLLSATPMFNNYKEIIWLINLMNLNDKRPIVSIKDIFDENGNFKVNKDDGEEIGLHKFIRKINGYVSFVQGEDPVNFPFRIFPTYFNKERSVLNKQYPKQQFDDSPISIPLKHIDLYTIHLNEYQENIYNYLIDNIKISSTTNEALRYQIFQIPLNILNITYPCELFDNIQTNNQIKFNKGIFVKNIGKEGLVSIFNDITKFPFYYNTEIVKQYGRIFDNSIIEKYSSKIHNICNSINSSEGITLIYSEKIYSGYFLWH